MNKPIGAHTVYRFVGREAQYLNAVPARDLIGADLMGVEQREGITEADIANCGLYEPVDLAEIEAFCGAPTSDGGRCRRPVPQWGDRCWQHKEVEEEE